MATVDALKKALTETLESKGVMGELKAKVRTEVFRALDDPVATKPKLSNENLLINDLIREYLIFNNYKYTDSVLVAESGQPEVQLEREFLCQELNVDDNGNAGNIPLLYSLLNSFIQQGKTDKEDRRFGLCTSSLPKTGSPSGLVMKGAKQMQ